MIPREVVEIAPEPSEAEREAILAALAAADQHEDGAWAEAARAEGVEAADPEP